MKNLYLSYSLLLSSAAITISACAPAADPTVPEDAPQAAESVAVSALSAPTLSVAAGLGQSCATGSSGIQCWGSNDRGQVGAGPSMGFSITPVRITGVTFGTTMLVAGGHHTCAVINGAAKCWGANDGGQLGNAPAGDDTTVRGDSSTPVVATGLGSGVQVIAAGDTHTCAVVNGAAKCWGANGFGEVGDGSTTLRRSPAGVGNLGSGVQVITAGGNHSCAIANGAALCWGLNSSGQLGDTTTTNPAPGDSHVPMPVTGLGSGVQAIAAGLNHTCAIVSGAAKCWGANDAGQLGNHQKGQNVGAPVQVLGLTSGVVAIAAGQSHSCALLSSGTVQCWGSNGNGQLGNGSTDPNVPKPADSDVPVQVTNLTSGVQSIAAGDQHSCAATTTGGVLCWGSNGNGQIATNPDDAFRFPAPHAIGGLVLGGCADGSDEQVFNNGMVGCAGTIAFANRATLCATGYVPVTALQWTSNRGTATPSHHYWTNEPLRWSGAGTGACFVSMSVGSDSCGTNPMHVCASGGADPEGNVCNWSQCGLYTNAPNQFFGGCAGATAGTVCIPNFAPANACTHVNSCAKWENGFSTSTSTELPGVFGSSTSCTQFCAGAGQCNPASCGPMSTPVTDCNNAATNRLNQLKANVAAAVGAEANFDNLLALQQRSAAAQAAMNVTTSYYTSTSNFRQNCSAGLIIIGGGGGCQLFWDQAVGCQLNIVNSIPVTGANDACGCSP